MHYEAYRLKNGLNVILVPQKDTASMTAMVMYPVGSRYEPEHLRGVSHYIEHLMFKGTKKRKNSFILTREIDRLGAEYNAFTSKEYTAYYIKTDAMYTEVSCDILSDMLFHSLFDAKEMEKEKHVIVEEIRMYHDNPLMNIDSIFEQVLFAGPLGVDIAGTEKHVLSYKREDVLNFRDRHYHPGNATLVIAGKITEKTKEMIETYFGLPDAIKKTPGKFSVAAFGGGAKKNRLQIQHKKTDQVQLMLGFPAFSHTDKRSAALSVMNTVLGGSMSSRLFVRIREKLGLAYTVRSGAETFRDTGYAYVRAGLEAKNINKAIHAIRGEMEKVIERGITDRELADAKTHIHGSLTLSLEDSSTQANWYARQHLFMDKIYTPEERLKDIEKVTRDDVKKIAKQVLAFQRLRVGIIGDVTEDQIKF